MAKKDLRLTLTPDQKKFCEIYVSEEFFCNWVNSYIQAYNIDTSKKGAYDSAKAAAREMLNNKKILDYIDSILELWWLNDSYVDKQLHKLISQDADKTAKLWAIKEYNTLKARIEKGRQKALDNKEITKEAIAQINVVIKWKEEWWEILE